MLQSFETIAMAALLLGSPPTVFLPWMIPSISAFRLAVQRLILFPHYRAHAVSLEIIT